MTARMTYVVRGCRDVDRFARSLLGTGHPGYLICGKRIPLPGLVCREVRRLPAATKDPKAVHLEAVYRE